MDTTQQQARDYLTSQHVMTLATSKGGKPWAAALFYVSAGWELLFVSAETTRHALHFTKNNHVAATIQANTADWHNIKGIQLEGKVEKLEGVEREVGMARYWGKFKGLGRDHPQIKAALSKVNLYRLTPTALYFIDNSVRLGHRTRIRLLG